MQSSNIPIDFLYMGGEQWLQWSEGVWKQHSPAHTWMFAELLLKEDWIYWEASNNWQLLQGFTSKSDCACTSLLKQCLYFKMILKIKSD